MLDMKEYTTKEGLEEIKPNKSKGRRSATSNYIIHKSVFVKLYYFD